MYVIMVYDVCEKRVNKVLGIGRKYLNWVQNSVLAGEISSAQFERLKAEVLGVIEEEEDFVLFYKVRIERQLKKEKLGTPKSEPTLFI